MALRSFTASFSSIKEALTCFICTDLAKDPILTPCCHHICCSKCIKSWLQNHTDCPFCREEITYSNLIDLSWAKNIPKLIHFFSGSEESICSIHNKKYIYYCDTCKQMLCSDCMYDLFLQKDLKHQHHSIRKIEEIIIRIKSQIQKELSYLLQIITATSEISAQISKISYQLQQKSDDHRYDLYDSFQQVKKEYENRVDESIKLNNESLMSCINSKIRLQDALEKIEQNKNESDPEKVKIIFKQSIEKAFNSLPSGVQSPVLNPITPPFHTVKIELTNYKQMVTNFRGLQNEGEGYFFFSKALHLFGNVWRAKIYPCGHLNGFGTHMSFFVELKQGYGHGSRFSYKVEVVPRKPNVQPFHREYTSEFQETDSWGWNKLAPIDNLMKDDFLNPNGSLVLIFSLRPLSYWQAKRDCEYEIEKVKEKISQLNLPN